MKVSAIQHKWHNSKEETMSVSESLIRSAANQGCDLICLQELHTGPYFCQHEGIEIFELAEPLDGPTSQWLGTLAEELNVVIVGSIFEERGPGLYHNTAIVFDKEKSPCGFYRKMHIPDDPGFYEKYYFTPGDAKTPGFSPIQTSIGSLGVLVCWDQWFPEAARLMALAGADILIYPTAIGWEPAENKEEKLRQQQAWMIVQRGHAVANSLPVIASNRIGHEADPTGYLDGTEFWGNSFICGPQGEILQQADDHSEVALIAEIDTTRTRTIRQTWPFLRDRRIDAYDDIKYRWRK